METLLTISSHGRLIVKTDTGRAALMEVVLGWNQRAGSWLSSLPLNAPITQKDGKLLVWRENIGLHAAAGTQTAYAFGSLEIASSSSTSIYLVTWTSCFLSFLGGRGGGVGQGNGPSPFLH